MVAGRPSPLECFSVGNLYLQRVGPAHPPPATICLAGDVQVQALGKLVLTIVAPYPNPNPSTVSCPTPPHLLVDRPGRADVVLLSIYRLAKSGHSAMPWLPGKWNVVLVWCEWVLWLDAGCWMPAAATFCHRCPCSCWDPWRCCLAVPPQCLILFPVVAISSLLLLLFSLFSPPPTHSFLRLRSLCILRFPQPQSLFKTPLYTY